MQVEKFVASEIDESAIRLVQNRHPDVIHVGDITKLMSGDIEKHGPFDLVIGGSPCNDLSGANPKRKGLLGEVLPSVLTLVQFNPFSWTLTFLKEV